MSLQGLTFFFFKAHKEQHRDLPSSKHNASGKRLRVTLRVPWNIAVAASKSQFYSTKCGKLIRIWTTHLMLEIYRLPHPM